MATNWKKILFEGANIEVGAITASDVPTIASADFNATYKVIAAVSESGEFRFTQITQDNLNSLQGGTTFLVTSSDSATNNAIDFNANGHQLLFSSPAATNVFQFSVSSSTSGIDTTKHVIADLTSPFPSASDNLNIISYSLDVGLAAQSGKPIGWNDFYTDFWTNGIVANSQSAYENAHYITNTNEYATVANFPFNINDSYTNAEGNTETPIVVNLWRNIFLEVGGTYTQPPYNPYIDGKRTYYWLSGSYVGGLKGDGDNVHVGLEDGYTNLNTTTGSIITTLDGIIDSSESLATVITDAADSGYVDNDNIHLKRGAEFVTSKVVTNPETGEDINQVTITHYDENDATNPQGFKVELGDSNNHLVIDGFLSASALELNNDGDVALQINVETYNSDTPGYDTGENGTQFGTTTANSHSFQGVVIIQSESGLNVNGDVTIDSTLPDEDPNVENPSVLSITGNNLRQSEINETNTFGGIISGSSDFDAGLFSSSISAASQSVNGSITDTNLIADLTGGYTDNSDSLENTYDNGILFGTSSNASTFATNTINGSTVQLIKTASFKAISASLVATDMLSWTHATNDSGSDLTLTIDPNEFAAVSSIFTGSGEIEDAVSGLGANGYVLDSAGVFTGSNAANADNFTASYTDADIAFISNLADGLPGADADDFFITGAGSFNDLDSTPGLGTLTDQSMSDTQGVLDFYLESVYQFGATGSKMATNGSPQFTDLTIDDGNGGGDLTVEGSLVTVDTTNMMVSDQFIMVNSGALRPDTEAVDSDNDKDGGIIIADGEGSGSLLMYDFTRKVWGFKGATGAEGSSTKVPLDAQSSNGGAIVPDVVVRTVLYSTSVLNNAGDCPTSIPYGASAEDSVGTMCVSANGSDTEGNVFVAVG